MTAAVRGLEGRARAAIASGDWPAAIRTLRAVADLQPEAARAWINLARARVKGGDDPTDALRRAMLLTPGEATAIEIAVTVAASGIDDRRWAWLACIAPAHALATKVMAAGLQKIGRAREARELFARTVALNPDDADAAVNLALCEVELGGHDRALDVLADVLERVPDEDRARYASGWIRLARRDWSGYEDYDARWRMPDPQERSHLIAAPLWHGEPVESGHLALTAQFGVGDEILFAGMVPAVARRAEGGVVLEADARLVPLFARSFPDITVVGRADPPVPALTVAAAAQSSVARLPVFAGPGRESFAPVVPYLTADPGRVAYWRQRLAALGPGPYTGIAWRSGNRRTGGRKSIPLPVLDPLLSVLGGTVVSLQYDPDPEEIAEARAAGHPVPVDNPAADIRDALDDLAAQIAAYDRVVTISGVNAHLAGALGVPTIVLMQRDPLWFWFAEGEEVPWYPSLTLIRQRSDDWAEVVAEAVLRLQAPPPN